MAPAALSPDAELGSRVTRALGSWFDVDGEIGRGGMGIVYHAVDRRLKRAVAVKVLPPDLAFRADIRTRFLHEAETAAQLTHPNIVPIYSVDEREGLVYFVMAFVDGQTLAQRLKGAVSPLRAWTRHGGSFARLRPPSPMHTRTESFTGTSSPTTSCSPTAVR